MVSKYYGCSGACSSHSTVFRLPNGLSPRSPTQLHPPRSQAYVHKMARNVNYQERIMIPEEAEITGGNKPKN